MKIYIPHYTKLVERKELMIKHLNESGFTNFIFFEDFDKEVINDARFSSSEELIRKRISKFIPENIIKNFLRDGLTSGEKSLALKHENIYDTFLKTSDKSDILLVLEDDARLCFEFKKCLDFLIKQANFDCLNFSANTLKKLVPTEENPLKQIKTHVIDHHPFDTGTEAYLMKYECVEKIFNHLKSDYICLPIDWELSYYFMNFDMKCRRTSPPLCYQASADGTFKSSVRDRGNDY